MKDCFSAEPKAANIAYLVNSLFAEKEKKVNSASVPELD
jgi:hypothetical protein